MRLRTLDVILLEGSRASVPDLVIMSWTKSPFTHCVVVKNEQGDIWDATIGGILDRNIKEYGDRYKTVCRYNGELTIPKMGDIISWINARQKTCEGYDYLSWLGFATGIKELESEDRWFCSELPYWMYQDNGIKLTPEDETFIQPRFFLYDKHFDTILWQEIEI